MASQQFVQTIRDWTDEFFQGQVGWDFQWEVTFGMAAPNQSRIPQPIVQIVMFMPGILIGTWIQAMHLVTDPLGVATRPTGKTELHNGLLNLMQEALQERQKASQPSPQTGNGGLIIPGTAVK